MNASEFEIPVTVSVPEYGAAALGLSRNGSYAAAIAGIFETIEVQGKKRVPVRKNLRRLAGDDPGILEAVTRDFLSKLRRKVAA
jgi:hypothetical protein